jgi:hypothetical protein
MPSASSMSSNRKNALIGNKPERRRRVANALLPFGVGNRQEGATPGVAPVSERGE